MNTTMNTTENTCSREDREREYTNAKERAFIGEGVTDDILRQVVGLMPGGCSIESIELFNGGPTYSVELFYYYSGDQYLLYNYNPWSRTFERKAWRARSGPYSDGWNWEKKYKKKARR